MPTRFNLSYDRTCNLSCPSCRREPIAAKGAELERIEAVTDGLLPLLRGGERLEVTGSGDPFASKSFRRLLASINRDEFPRLKITIMTNGQLMRRSEWGKFAHLHGMIDAVNVSVDATRPETYAIVRRGGDLAELLPNLDFVGELRREGAIRHYRVCFVVQDHNFEEMPEFVELGQEVGADTLHFQMMHDWGTYERVELNRRRVHLGEHPKHSAFLEVLRSLPEPKAPKIISDFAYLT
jgi:MoaA/NifB/PqqE/SkfB family radical SAM enzyme